MTAVPGRTYALSFADTLTADAWQNAPGSLVKTSLGFSWQDPTTPPAPPRYYLLHGSR